MADKHFGAQLYSKGAIASSPLARGVTLTALPTHVVHSAACGPFDTSEMLYAKQLIRFEHHFFAVTRSYGKPPASMKHLRERPVSLPNDERPDHTCDRAFKTRSNRYAVQGVRMTA
jgi:hypothetical protein